MNAPSPAAWAAGDMPGDLGELLDGAPRLLTFSGDLFLDGAARAALWAATEDGRAVIVQATPWPCGCEAASLPQWAPSVARFVGSCETHGEVRVTARELPLLILFDDPTGPAPGRYIAAAALGVVAADLASGARREAPDAAPPPLPEEGDIIFAAPAGAQVAASVAPDKKTVAFWLREEVHCGCPAHGVLAQPEDSVRWEWRDDAWRAAPARRGCAGPGADHDRRRIHLRHLPALAAGDATPQVLQAAALAIWGENSTERELGAVLARSSALMDVEDLANSLAAGEQPDETAAPLMGTARIDDAGAWWVEISYSDGSGTPAGEHREQVELPAACAPALAAQLTVGLDL